MVWVVDCVWAWQSPSGPIEHGVGGGLCVGLAVAQWAHREDDGRAAECVPLAAQPAVRGRLVDEEGEGRAHRVEHLEESNMSKYSYQ